MVRDGVDVSGEIATLHELAGHSPGRSAVSIPNGFGLVVLSAAKSAVPDRTPLDSVCSGVSVYPCRPMMSTYSPPPAAK
jgi:hypothetical protein